MQIAVAYAVALIAFIGLDMVWLGTMVDRLYRPVIGDMMAASVNFPAAILFYLLAPAGLVYFAVAPALRTSSLASALTAGAAYGFFTYLTYDLTNQATLKNWSTALSAADIAWGVVLGAMSSAIAYAVASRIG